VEPTILLLGGGAATRDSRADQFKAASVGGLFQSPACRGACANYHCPVALPQRHKDIRRAKLTDTTRSCVNSAVSFGSSRRRARPSRDRPSGSHALGGRRPSCRDEATNRCSSPTGSLLVHMLACAELISRSPARSSGDRDRGPTASGSAESRWSGDRHCLASAA
jgi:hypothetical protein